MLSASSSLAATGDALHTSDVNEGLRRSISELSSLALEIVLANGETTGGSDVDSADGDDAFTDADEARLSRCSEDE